MFSIPQEINTAYDRLLEKREKRCQVLSFANQWAQSNYKNSKKQDSIFHFFQPAFHSRTPANKFFFAVHQGNNQINYPF